ncbi:MAG: PorT family protein [Chitinophagaceae bacterium]|nr:PorT family protein [Chitinophagaceae bacterium]
MKKLILFIVVTFSLMSTATAQSRAEELFKTYRFGLFLGPSINSLRPTSSLIDKYTISKGKGNIGFSFGITADYNINERYTIFSGIGLDWRGGQINAIHDSSAPASDYAKSANVTYRQQYLTIPLGLKMMATRIDKLKILAQTGFDLGILLSQRGDFVIMPNSGATVIGAKTKLSGYATGVPVNIGWYIGPGVEYDLNGKNAVFASILYRNGFVDATTPKNNNAGLKFSDGNIRSNSFALRVGYFF